MADVSVREPRKAAVKQMEQMKQLTSGGGGLSGGLSVVEPPSSPSTSARAGPTPSHHKRPPDGTPSSSHHKRQLAQTPQIIKRRRAHVQQPLDVKEYLENDGERGIQQRVGEGPPRPHTPHLIFLRERGADAIKQPEKREAWTPDEVAHGIALLYMMLPREKRLDLERTSDQQMLAYKDEFKKYKAAQDVRDQNTPAQAFDIYEANNRARVEYQFPHLSQSEVDDKVKRDWDELPDEQRQAYLFLADRDWQRVKGHNCLWLTDASRPQPPAPGDPEPPQRKFVSCLPQFCSYCGLTLVGSSLRTCHNCGKTVDVSVIAFGIGADWAPRKKVPADESQEVDVVGE